MMNQDPNSFTQKKAFQKILSIAIPCLFGWIFSYAAIHIYKDYAFGLFIWLPMVLGATSTLILSYKNSITRKQLRNNAFLTILILCLGMLLFAWEGIICIIMAMPIGLLFTYIGFIITNAFLKNSSSKMAPSIIITLLLSVPALMAFEDTLKREDDLRSVVTSVEIKASPQIVWKNVVTFPELPAPKEFVFKTGIAFPINATIDGNGVGAIRYCNFSTGGFIEPITVWDEPRLLRFSVATQPEPMKEISPFDIHPNHLHGYWISKQGQFKLTLLPNGNTLLEGTTWYINKIKPNFYWSIWSDYIVHKIHDRVLEHIKIQSEL